jgi:RHS repeat-associated protein
MPFHRTCRDNPALVGDPVDVTSGANTDITGEFSLRGAEPFKWQRYYNSLHHRWPRALGLGHTHEYDHQLLFDVDGLRYAGPDGEPIGFDALLNDGQTAQNGGYRLTRISSRVYKLWRWRERDELIFVFRPFAVGAPVSEIRTGDRSLVFRYNNEGGLAWIALPDGRSIEAHSDALGRVTALLLIGSDKSAIPKRLIGYEYDAAGNLVRGVDAYRNWFSFRYDFDNRMVARTDRNGYSFLFEYDAAGWCVRAGGEDGVQEVCLRYLRPERVTMVIKPGGAEWTYFYNEFRQVTQIIDPLGGTQKFLIDESGVVTGETDANGNLTKYVYSREGEPVAKISPIGIRYGFQEPPPPPYRPHRVADTPRMFEYGDSTGASVGLPASFSISLRKILREEEAPSEHSETEFADFGLAIRQRARSGAFRAWGYDANGNLTRIRDFSGATYTYEYSSWNHAVRRTDPLGASVHGSYTSLERLASIADEGAVTHEYAYDLGGRVSQVRRYGKLLETYEYDAAGNLITKRHGDGNVMLRFEIGPGNLVAARALSSGDVQRFEYDAAGRILKAANQSAEIDFAYDEAGCRVRDQRDGLGVVRRFENGMEEIEVLGRYRMAYRHHRDGSVVITDPTGRAHRITHPEPHITARQMSNGSTEYTRYDATGSVLAKIVTRRRAQTPWVRRYAWSPDGDLLRLEDSLFGAHSCSYDAAHRLREVALPDNSRQAFAYDAAGNLMRAPGLTGVVLGQGNQLRSANGDSFSYDSRGRLVERCHPLSSTTYEYDSKDMLVAVKTGQETWKAEYDAIGRRVRKEADRSAVEYYWDTDRLVAERDSNGRLRVYVYADDLALTPFLLIDYASADSSGPPGIPYFLFSNQVGAPVLIENQAGEVVWRCTYTPYGSATVHPDSAIACHLRFPGHYFDSETGLHYNRFRYYSPELGRYLQMDPEGIPGGLNLYAYTRNPLVQVDVRGLACKRHRGRGGSRTDCEDCRLLDEAVPHALETAEPGTITSREQLVTATENRAAILREGMPQTERGPCFSMAAFEDGKGSAFAHINHEDRPPNLHPILQDRLDNPPTRGWSETHGTPGSHSEIWAANEAMWERDRQLGRPLTEEDLNGLNVHNEYIEGNRGGPMRCCPN